MKALRLLRSSRSLCASIQLRRTFHSHVSTVSRLAQYQLVRAERLQIRSIIGQATMPKRGLAETVAAKDELIVKVPSMGESIVEGNYTGMHAHLSLLKLTLTGVFRYGVGLAQEGR